MSGLARVGLFLVILLGAVIYVWNNREYSQYPGILSPDDPVQIDLNRADEIVLDEYTLTPLAEFQIDARVLSARRYFFGRETDLSPVDLALGWGQMSDTAVLDYLDISQSGRWYFWSASQMPIAKRDVIRQSANMHMIPADAHVEKAIKKARKGQVVALDGYLVKVNASDGWHWTSSTSRGDTGDGSCEVVYVKNFEIKQ